MKRQLIVFIITIYLCMAVGIEHSQTSAQANLDEDFASHFIGDVNINAVPCTLQNGVATTCYQIETTALPDFDIGPFCPETLDDVGCIWDWDGNNAGLYDYHASLDFPNLPKCLMGVVARGNFVTTATKGIGSQNLPNNSPAGGQNQQPPQQGEPNLEGAAQQLGVTVQQLRNALGTPPLDFPAAARQLGVTVEALQNALGVVPPR